MCKYFIVYKANLNIQSQPKYDIDELEIILERDARKRKFDKAFYEDDHKYSKMSNYKYGCSSVPFRRSSGNDGNNKCIMVQPLKEYDFNM